MTFDLPGKTAVCVTPSSSTCTMTGTSPPLATMNSCNIFSRRWTSNTSRWWPRWPFWKRRSPPSRSCLHQNVSNSFWSLDDALSSTLPISVHGNNVHSSLVARYILLCTTPPPILYSFNDMSYSSLPPPIPPTPPFSFIHTYMKTLSSVFTFYLCCQMWMKQWWWKKMEQILYLFIINIIKWLPDFLCIPEFWNDFGTFEGLWKKRCPFIWGCKNVA